MRTPASLARRPTEPERRFGHVGTDLVASHDRGAKMPIVLNQSLTGLVLALSLAACGSVGTSSEIPASPPTAAGTLGSTRTLEPTTAAPTDGAGVVCDGPAGSVTDVAGEPDWRRYGDYRPWTTADGCLVRIDVLADRPGPSHCGWETARVIIAAIPIGTRYSNETNDANYVRDPDNVFGDAATASAFDPDAELPAGAVDTGFRQGSTELWADPADGGSAIYLVTGTSIERWPLDPQPAVCT